MNRIILIVIFSLSIVLFASCDREQPVDDTDIVGIEGITFENYPKVDCSTSARALSVMAACKLLNVRYRWMFSACF